MHRLCIAAFVLALLALGFALVALWKANQLASGSVKLPHAQNELRAALAECVAAAAAIDVTGSYPPSSNPDYVAFTVADIAEAAALSDASALSYHLDALKGRLSITEGLGLGRLVVRCRTGLALMRAQERLRPSGIDEPPAAGQPAPSHVPATSDMLSEDQWRELVSRHGAEWGLDPQTGRVVDQQRYQAALEKFRPPGIDD